MIVRYLLVFSAFLGITSCHSSEEDSFIEFESEHNLSGIHVGPGNIFLDPKQVLVYKNYILLLDSGTDELLHILGSRSFEMLKSFGHIGRGPGEFIFPEFALNIYNDTILITDKARFIAKEYNLDSIIAKGSFYPNQSFVFDFKYVIPYFNTLLNDSSIVGVTTNGTCRLFKINKYTHEAIDLEMDISFPGDEDMNKSDLGQVLYSFVSSNGEKNILVNALRFFPRIDILDPNLKYIESIKLEESNYEFHAGESWISEDLKFYYVGLSTTSRYIYALYSGQTLKDTDYPVGKEIHVFSWNGEPKEKYILEDSLIYIFVPEGDSILLGINPFDEKPLMKFNL